jgi:heme exporter protein B
VLLPVVHFPPLVPVLIAAVKATDAILAGGGWQETGVWIKVLGAFALIFTVASAVVFEYVLEE